MKHTSIPANTEPESSHRTRAAIYQREQFKRHARLLMIAVVPLLFWCAPARSQVAPPAPPVPDFSKPNPCKTPSGGKPSLNNRVSCLKHHYDKLTSKDGF